MFTRHLITVQEIFVGRKEELAYLDSLWNASLKEGEHFVHVMLNAPGTGKTRLLKFFGETLETERKGLYFHYNCDGRHWTTSSLHRSILEEISELIFTRTRYIHEYIIHAYPDLEERNYRLERFEELKHQISRLLKRSEGINLDDVVSILQGLSRIIPLLFIADEIQEFQKVTLEVDEPSLLSQDIEEETALHYFTRILKSLMRSRVLMILSGTQYHILTQIGFKIGSPIAQKVRQIIIKNLSLEEVDEYVEQAWLTIVQPNVNENLLSNPNKLSALKKYHYKFLHSFSGGHPRTIAFSTERFLMKLSELLQAQKLPPENAFIDELFSLIKEDFNIQLLTREKQAQIQELQASELFPLVKNWILARSHTGFKLGPRPKVDNPRDQEEIDRLVFQLMNIGVIVQNGSGVFHLTSYFHLLAFLDSLADDHPQKPTP